MANSPVGVQYQTILRAAPNGKWISTGAPLKSIYRQAQAEIALPILLTVDMKLFTKCCWHNIFKWAENYVMFDIGTSIESLNKGYNKLKLRMGQNI